MHAAVHQFIQYVKGNFPLYFRNSNVLEVGSFNMNGTARIHFEGCQYTGIDWRPGLGVDLVVKAHEAKFPDNTFDVIVCTEMLEHDKFAELSVQNMIRMLKNYGLLIITCATTNRIPHEITCGVESHYKNIERNEMDKWLRKYKIREIFVKGNDLQVWVIKDPRMMGI